MENEIQPYSFGIIRILDCGFSIQELIPPDPDKILIGYGMNFAFDVQEGWIEYLLKAEFKHSDKNLTFLTGSVLTRFAIIDFASFLGDDNKVFFPPGSLETLFGIAFGHLRAIMAKNVSGSRFAAIIVPVINPDTLFHELLQMNIDATGNEDGYNVVDLDRVAPKKGEKLKFKPEEKQDIESVVLANRTTTIEDQINESRERVKKIKKISEDMRSENSKKEIKQKH
jgi:hypothetical protein